MCLCLCVCLLIGEKGHSYFRRQLTVTHCVFFCIFPEDAEPTSNVCDYVLHHNIH